jgi:hypothetical protein
MSVREGGHSQPAQQEPEFIPVVSLSWLARAVEVAGAHGALVALIAWRESAMSNYRKHGRRDTPGYAKLTYRRVRDRFGTQSRTIRAALIRLHDAGLLEVIRPNANGAYQVRVIPIEGEEYWTYSRLGNRAEAREYPKPTTKRE